MISHDFPKTMPSSPSQEKKGIGHQKGHAEAAECVEAALLIRRVGRCKEETGKEANGNLCRGWDVFMAKKGKNYQKTWDFTGKYRGWNHVHTPFWDCRGLHGWGCHLKTSYCLTAKFSAYTSIHMYFLCTQSSYIWCEHRSPSWGLGSQFQPIPNIPRNTWELWNYGGQQGYAILPSGLPTHPRRIDEPDRRQDPLHLETNRVGAEHRHLYQNTNI